jgi:hypothetical protein
MPKFTGDLDGTFVGFETAVAEENSLKTGMFD